MEKYTALRLCDLAIPWLRAKHPDGIIVKEFVCGSAGDPRIDIACITPKGIIGVENKSDTDSIDRLASQGTTYSSVCAYTYLFASPNLMVAEKNKQKWWRAAPAWWGMMGHTEGRGVYLMREAPYSKFLAPHAIVGLLWKNELHKLAKDKGLEPKASWNREKLGNLLVDNIPLPVLHLAAMEVLRARDWVSPWTMTSRLVDATD